MDSDVLVYEPVASPNEAQQLRQALDRVDGKVIGFIDNAKPNFNYLVDDLAEQLTSKYGAIAVIKRRKARAGIPASDTLMRELSQECDAIITGSGD